MLRVLPACHIDTSMTYMLAVADCAEEFGCGLYDGNVPVIYHILHGMHMQQL